MPTVLIVDDDHEVRDMLAEAIAAEGYSVCEAVDGEEALELLQSMPFPPRLVLLDMMMPRMDGNELLAAVALSPKLAAIPIVVVSAYPGLVNGLAKETMRKPIELEALLGVVAKFCGVG